MGTKEKNNDGITRQGAIKKEETTATIKSKITSSVSPQQLEG
jgi:hypothetical protein